MTSPINNLSNNSFNNFISAQQKNLPQVVTAQNQEIAEQKEIQQAQGNTQVESEPQAQPKKTLQDDIFDKINAKVINSKDITDTVTLPRAIFKGYFSFFVGSTIGVLSAAMPKKAVKTKAFMAIAGSAIAILGTFEFLKPLLLKQKSEEKA